LLALFYRRVEVVAAERLEVRGPLVVAANHQNALVDPMLVLAAVPRRLVPLAKSTLFRHPMIGPFLRLAGALPVERRADVAGGPTLNAETFASVTRALEADGAVLIFPEGVSQPEPALMPLRTGAARIVLDAPPELAARVTLLPVGLTLHEPGRFRIGRALVVVGPRVETADCVALHARAPEEAVRLLTGRLAEALRHVIVEVGDRETLRLVDEAEAIWRAEDPESLPDAGARAEWRRRAAVAYRYLLDREPGRIRAMRAQLERYAKGCEQSGLTPPLLAGEVGPRAALRYAVGQGLSLLLGFPLALWGMANHALPYWLTGVLVRRLHPDDDAEATYKLAAGIVVYPLAWVAEGWTAWRIGGGVLLAAFVAGLVPSGFFALAWSERLGRVARDARAWLRLLADRDVARDLAEQRRAILAELNALVALVPESVLKGPTEAGR